MESFCLIPYNIRHIPTAIHIIFKWLYSPYSWKIPLLFHLSATIIPPLFLKISHCYSTRPPQPYCAMSSDNWLATDHQCHTYSHKQIQTNTNNLPTDSWHIRHYKGKQLNLPPPLSSVSFKPMSFTPCLPSTICTQPMFCVFQLEPEGPNTINDHDWPPQVPVIVNGQYWMDYRLQV